MSRLGPDNPRKILIRGTNWVGDSVISIPAMREIRRLFPKAHIALLVRPWVREIYTSVGFIDEILEYDKQGNHRGLSGFYRLVADLRKRGFDLAILLQNAFEAALIAWCAGIPKRAGYRRDGRGFLLTHACSIDPEVRRVHQAYYYLGILSSLGLMEDRPWENPSRELSVRIDIGAADRKSARLQLQAGGIHPDQLKVGLNPGAFYGEAKRWLPDRYASVADTLVDQYGARIILFGSASDLPVVEEVASQMKAPFLNLAGKTSLGQLMALISECSLLITNDSGPMHLAAALDVPQLAIFGSTSEIATGPLSKSAVIIKNPADCNPCFLRECPTDFRCMNSISVEQVVAAAKRHLDSASAAGSEGARISPGFL